MCIVLLLKCHVNSCLVSLSSSPKLTGTDSSTGPQSTALGRRICAKFGQLLFHWTAVGSALALHSGF